MNSLKDKHRSKLEERVCEKLGKGYLYEAVKLTYQKSPSKYTPDLILENGIFIEIKGYFDAEDRSKHLLIQKQHPEIDLRFVFQKSNKKIHKSSSTTYADWCDKYGFKYAEGEVPDEWRREEGNTYGKQIYKDIQPKRRKTTGKNTKKPRKAAKSTKKES